MTNIQNATTTAKAVKDAYQAQSPWYRRKSTLINLLQGIGWVLGALTTIAASWPEWAILLIGGLSTLVASALSALTKGEITPSMVARIAAHAPDDAPKTAATEPEHAKLASVDLDVDYAAYINAVAPSTQPEA